MATYYVKNGGSNTNTGLSDAQAFATPEYAQSVAVAGDTILLNRGSVWFGFTPQKAGTAGSPFTWGVYGTGEKPVISGYKVLTGWVSIGGGLYECEDNDLQPRTKFLKIDGALTTVSRFPRENYYQITGATNTGPLDASGNPTGTQGTITDTVNLAGRNFTGGEIVVKKTAWVLDTMSISSHSGSTISFTGGTIYIVQNGWGYAVQNHRNTCISLLDWCQESNKIIMYFGADNPDFYEIKAPVLAQINFSSKGHNTFSENIVFEGFNGGSDFDNGTPVFPIHNSQNLKFLDGCEFNEMGNTVFHFTSSNNNGFELNNITGKDCLNMFFWNRFSASTPQFQIRDCELENIGAILGAGGNGDVGYSAIEFAGSSGPCFVQKNRLKNIGYNGIDFAGYEYLIEDNIVENACSILGDGACFYTYGKNDVGKTYVRSKRIIRNNIALNSPGNGWGTSVQFNSGVPSFYFGEGYYLDDDGRNMTIEDNLAIGCRSGLKVQNNKDIYFRRNLFFNNISLQVIFANNGNGDFDIENLDWQENILYSNSGQIVMQVEANADKFYLIGVFDNNYYMRPSNESGIIRHLRTGAGGFDNYLSLAQWKTTNLGLGKFVDQNSVGTPTTSTIANVYYNDTFVDNVLQDIQRVRVNKDGDEITELRLNSFNFDILLDDLGPLTPDPDPTFNITIVVSPSGYGTVVKDPVGPQEEGESYTLTATPNSGKEFVKFVFVDEESTDNPYTGTMGNANTSILAEFRTIPETGFITARGRFVIG